MDNPNAYVSLATQTVLSPRGKMLARVCIVVSSTLGGVELAEANASDLQDYQGDILLDLLVLPTDEVIDYHAPRTGFKESYFAPSSKLHCHL